MCANRLRKKNTVGTGCSPVNARLVGSERKGSVSSIRAPSRARCSPKVSHTITYPVHPQMKSSSRRRHPVIHAMRARAPASSLREHAEGVDGRRDDGEIAGVAVQPAHPVAQPRIAGQPRHRLPRRADAIEEDEPEAGHEQHEIEGDDDGAALVEGIEPLTVQTVTERIRRRQQPERQSLGGACDGSHELTAFLPDRRRLRI